MNATSRRLPLFAALMTGCTAEFDHESSKLDQDRPALKSSVLADSYWRERAVPHAVLSVDQCRQRKPRQLDRCGDGPLVVAKMSVGLIGEIIDVIPFLEHRIVW